jgi:hypothetical protein
MKREHTEAFELGRAQGRKEGGSAAIAEATFVLVEAGVAIELAAKAIRAARAVL